MDAKPTFVKAALSDLAAAISRSWSCSINNKNSQTMVQTVKYGKH